MSVHKVSVGCVLVLVPEPTFELDQCIQTEKVTGLEPDKKGRVIYSMLKKKNKIKRQRLTVYMEK